MPNEKTGSEFSAEDFPIKPIKEIIHTFEFESTLLSSDCLHLNEAADYLGSTCRSCKKTLSGKGFGGLATHCVHVFEYDFGLKTQACTFCGEVKG